MSKVSDEIRKSFGESDRKRDANLTTPDDVIRYDDIVYGTDSQWQVLDVYRPRNMEGKTLPVIVSVHGGGWMYGSKEVYQFYCMSLAQRGFAVVNFTYRLAPEVKFPASLEDTNSVFQWVLDNEDTYLFDCNNIFAVGDSAGGNILGLFCDLCINEAYAKQFSFQPPKGLKLNAVALNCGAYHLQLEGEKNQLHRDIVKELFQRQGQEDELVSIMVERHMTKDFPPTFVMTAVNDFIKDQAPIMTEKLEQLGIPYVYRCYGDEKNRLEHVFHCDIKTEDAKICNDEECQFFRSYVK
ncbi:alpha/beta hydrolase [Anaerosporobacter faecicola]|uniref:alpha/beta hydrolase n=1 Tax=Anaerosporobacter faecicola TaxID=2718714 RepID=UPI001439AF91|nr:alpha/beta hydrolase [Anaerosporobacter faecicola]